MMTLEIERQLAENTHSLPREDPKSRIYATIPGLQLDQFFKFISHDFLTSAELKFRFFPLQRKIEHPGW